MKITKYLHSCILVEDSGQRLLIDPGAFSFVEKRIAPADIPSPHTVLITHRHPDHFFPEALNVLTQDGTPVYAEPNICQEAKHAGIENCNAVLPGETIDQPPFNIQVIEGEHGDLPIPKPHNNCYLINDRVLHPGDSLTTKVDRVEVLLLPVAAPWLRAVDALDFAKRLMPKLVIPIHDGFIKEFFLTTIYERLCRPVLEKKGIAFQPLGLGESVEV